jgi:large subunit ribosomal protein L17
MRHYKKGRRLGTDASHTKAMKKSLVAHLFANDRIKTTLERAKEIRGDVDRVITWAKRGDVHSRRLAIAKLGDKDLVAEIFSKVEQGMFAGRAGGYSRILRLGMRRGDSATIVIMELVLEPLAKKDDKGADGKAAGKGAAGKGADKAAKKAAGKKGAAKKGADEAEATEEAAEGAAKKDADEAEVAETAEAETAEAVEAEEAAEVEVEAAEAETEAEVVESEAAEAEEAAADEAADAAEEPV